jgi:phosphatidylglycerol:prolipoprotein diacylglycerol transferase
MFIFNWLHNFQPNPVFLQIGFVKIHWYGLLIAIGAILGFLTVLFLAKKYNLKKETIYDLSFYLIIFGLIGDRLYYVFYAWEYYSKNLLDIFKIWQGGLAIHGAMIAGLLVIYIYGKRKKINPWLLTDLMIVALALAMAFGRWGNYFNQELFGRPTDLPWGIPITPDKRPTDFINNNFFHPTFIYESLWNLIIFTILFYWHKIRLNKNNPEQIKGYGNLTLVYFILYSLGRVLNEFLRIDYSPYFLGVRWAQLMSLIIIFSCGSIFLIKFLKRKFKKEI